MAESIQRILKRRGLVGQQPKTTEQIIEGLEQAAAGWNKAPTPFEWGGKWRAWRQRLRENGWPRRQRVGGIGAYALHSLALAVSKQPQSHRLSA